VKERKDRVDDALQRDPRGGRGRHRPGRRRRPAARQGARRPEGRQRRPEAGVDIVRRALQAPIRQIAENAGVDGSIVVGKLLEKARRRTFGFNAQTEEYGDMVKAGIIDPTKVVRTALQDAASVAGLLITTEAMIAEAPKKDAPPAACRAAAWAAWAAWTTGPGQAVP
jgi:chaperonin GroEL